MTSSELILAAVCVLLGLILVWERLSEGRERERVRSFYEGYIGNLQMVHREREEDLARRLWAALDRPLPRSTMIVQGNGQRIPEPEPQGPFPSISAMTPEAEALVHRMRAAGASEQEIWEALARTGPTEGVL